jgi:transposase
MRKTHGKEFKFKVSLEAIRGDLTIAQIVSKYQVAESLVHKWKKQLLDQGGDIFESKKGLKVTDSVDTDRLHAKIGKLSLEVDFLESAFLKGHCRSALK